MTCETGHMGLTLEADPVCFGLLRANSKANSWQGVTGEMNERGFDQFHVLTSYTGLIPDTKSGKPRRSFLDVPSHMLPIVELLVGCEQAKTYGVSFRCSMVLTLYARRLDLSRLVDDGDNGGEGTVSSVPAAQTPSRPRAGEAESVRL